MSFFLRKSIGIVGIGLALLMPCVTYAQQGSPAPAPSAASGSGSGGASGAAATPSAATGSGTAAGSGSSGLAPVSQTMHLSVPIGDTTEVTDLAQYIVVVYRYALGLVTTVAIIMVVYGGFQYLLGATGMAVNKGKQTIQDAIGGMVVLLLAYVILYTINPATVSLRMPGITKINEIGLAEQKSTYQNVIGGSCAVDRDCPAGGACLRTSPAGGICASGVQGNICKCRGTGCGVTDEQAGGPTNNSAAQAPVTRGTFPCQSGLTCAEVSADDWQCAGGTFSACNDSEETITHIDNAAIVDGLTHGASSGLNAAQSISPSDVRFVPFMVLASTVGTVGGGTIGALRALPDTYQSHVRQALHCSDSSQFCFQPYEGRAGACLFGDQRDTALFNGIEAFRTNQDLQSMIEHCSTDDTFVRSTPTALGGCKAVNSNQVNEYCVRHRYQCRNGAVCGEDAYASQFATTLRAYGSWDNAPAGLRPSKFYVSGCRKAIGAACQSDSECPSKCVVGHCSGFGIIYIRDGVTGVTQTPTFDQVDFDSVGASCGDQAWTEVDLLHIARTAGDTAAGNRALAMLTGAGNVDRFACYPKRPNGAKCDMSTQCTSGNCAMPAGSTLSGSIASFAAPLDNTAGVGTCGP